jgi:hypothetical protein
MQLGEPVGRQPVTDPVEMQRDPVAGTGVDQRLAAGRMPNGLSSRPSAT